MKWVTKFQRQLVLFTAILAPLVLAIALVPFRGSFANAAAALLFIAAVAAVAVAGNRFTGFIASCSGALWFDFFLTKPYDRFTISQRSDIETTICLLIVGSIVTELAARNRHHLQVANQESDFLGMINDLANVATEAEPENVVVTRATKFISTVLKLRSCRFETDFSGPPLARIGADGEVMHVGLIWPVLEIGIPGPEAEVLAKWRGVIVGRFILTPTPGLPISLERRVVAVALADLVGATLFEGHRVR